MLLFATVRDVGMYTQQCAEREVKDSRIVALDLHLS